MAEPAEIMKRPKDMTDAELRAIPFKSPLEDRRLSPYGLGGDDLMGFWQDADGRWWREDWPPL